MAYAANGNRAQSFDPCDPHKLFIRDRVLLRRNRPPVHPNFISVTSTSFAGDDDGVNAKLKGKPPGYDYDAERRRYCGKVLPCGHRCTDPAAWHMDPCGMCKIPVTVVRDCGHETTYLCGRGKPFIPCVKDCGRVLVCGHACFRKCSDKLCGKGICGGYTCIAEFPQEQKEFEELLSLLPPRDEAEDDW